MTQNTVPDALLFVVTECAHCPAVLQGLSGLVKEGVIGRLEVVNLATDPGRAAEYGVKTVPWLRLGPFELEGALLPGELRRWAERSGSLDGMADYFFEMLKHGRRDRVEEMARREPARLHALVRLLERPDTSMAVRLGIGAVLEELQGSGLAEVIIPGLGVLVRSGDALTRADACHFLSLIGSSAAIPFLRACLNDEDKEVREIAAESLEELETS